ncbi:MAG TPA: hypothetical protein VFS04_07140 [Alphaproteobacteria bacterium]|nr:hypothetical protein [Alphaproteobacteria bacterium]
MSKRLVCAVALATFGFAGSALAQNVIVQNPNPVVVNPAPVVVAPAPTVVAPAPVVVTNPPATVVYQPGYVYTKEVPSTTRRDGSSLAEDKGP